MRNTWHSHKCQRKQFGSRVWRVCGFEARQLFFFGVIAKVRCIWLRIKWAQIKDINVWYHNEWDWVNYMKLSPRRCTRIKMRRMKLEYVCIHGECWNGPKRFYGCVTKRITATGISSWFEMAR